jgi:hypothetical protein
VTAGEKPCSRQARNPGAYDGDPERAGQDIQENLTKKTRSEFATKHVIVQLTKRFVSRITDGWAITRDDPAPPIVRILTMCGLSPTRFSPEKSKC